MPIKIKTPTGSEIEQMLYKQQVEIIKKKIEAALRPIADKLGNAIIEIKLENGKLKYSVTGVPDSLCQEAENLISQALS